jgi:hypothetical protein
MHANALGTSSHRRGNGDLDTSAPRLPDAPQLGGALIAEEGVRATGQHSSHPAFEVADFTPTDDENPTMKATEPANSDAMGDPTLRHAQLQQLTPGDNAMLSPKKLPDLGVLVGSDRYSGPK